ncbi:hypothetical protein [Spirosoma validum]|uniref:Uncharacterized protein n=1 Tax=Spirosoma validum TaxID=2771355 RepID=A0A927B316_9BACT|nr:hypothetical protein [Spirosoma validum]MBD2754352.1 hypothetical protein [Spirosoma validum]
MQTKQPRWIQAILLYLLIANSVPGIWALFMPRDFYDSFPGFGRTWVAVDGPYNEHLIRDVGAFFVALATLCLLTLVAPRLITVRATAICLLVFNAPHLLYHLNHLHMLPMIDQVGNVVTLSMSVLLSTLLLFYRPVYERSQVLF